MPAAETSMSRSLIFAAVRVAALGALLAALVTVLLMSPALAGTEFSPSSVAKGVLLVASPMLNDTNFHQTVVLIVEHGPEGTLGLILNRATNVLLSEALPEVTALKGTGYRLFTGGRSSRPGYSCCSACMSLHPAHDQSSTASMWAGQQRS